MRRRLFWPFLGALVLLVGVAGCRAGLPSPNELTAGDGSSAGDGSGAGDSDSGKPGPNNTGVPPGVGLKQIGPLEVTTPDTLIEEVEVHGSVSIRARNVTLRRCRVISSDQSPVRVYNNGSLTIEDCEIVASGAAEQALGFSDIVARRLNIHGAMDGASADERFVVEDCWIHDLKASSQADGIESTGGSDIVIRRNNISGGQNAAISTRNDNGTVEQLSIEDNWLDGGGYTLDLRGNLSGTRVVGNRLGRDNRNGPLICDDPSPTISGNVWDDTGEPIP
jgi:type 1 fimbria pilin